MSDRQDLSRLEAYRILTKEENYDENEKYQHKRHARIRQGPDLAFLSHDAKVGLAVRSSIVARPGAYSIDSQKSISIRNKPSTQAEMLKMVEMKTTVNDTNILDGRHIPPKDEGHDGVPSYEGDPLRDLFNRMNLFQKEFEAETRENDERIKLLDKRRRLICWAVVTIGIVLILVIIIPVSIIFTKGSSESSISDESSHTGRPDSENIPFRIDDCYIPSMTDQARFDELRSLLISHHFNLSISIDQSYSSASVALCWLCNYDGLYLQPVAGNGRRILERFILALLYFSFVGNENFDNTFNIFSSQNWLSSMDVCNWTLVRCHESDNGDKSVSGLELSLVNLSGQKIPSEVALLQNLTNLHFYPRDMMGPIPTQLRQLTKLKEFTLSVLEDGGAKLNDIEYLIDLRFLLLKANYEGNLPDFNRLRKLTRLEIYDFDSKASVEFHDLQKLTNLGKHM
jgi:hypothetical protein